MKWHLPLRFLIICVTITLTADAAFAYSCGPVQPVLSAYDQAHAVIIGRVLSVEVSKSAAGIQEKDTDKDEIDGFGPAKVLVEKVYKGNLRVNREITAGSPRGWSFHEKWVGQQFLLYLIREDEAGTHWGASLCGRSRDLERAAEDLLYLDNIENLRGKTRISGNYSGGLGKPLDAVANRTIRITGEKKTYETKTNANGVFEIYDLPPGKYILEPEIPNGWQLARYLFNPDGTPDKLVPFTLEAKKHVTLDLMFVPANRVEGSVVGPDGNPLDHVCVYLVKTDKVDGEDQRGCTNINGNFSIGSVPAGAYIAVLNPDGKLSPDEPFPRMFYPNVTQREKAALITIGNGEAVEDINFVISSLAETVIVSGVLLFSDGKPAAKELVTFLPLNKDDFYGEHSRYTDSEGQFALKILKGLKGEIFGDVDNIKSPAIKLDPQHDIEDLVLTIKHKKAQKIFE